MVDEQQKRFNIQLAAQLAGISTHTIRAWEKRYQALTPVRTLNGRRLYTAEEIDRLIMLAQLTQKGNTISQIAKLDEKDLKETYNKLVLKGELSRKSPFADSVINIDEILPKLLKALEHYRVDVISQLLSEAKDAVSPKVFALEILAPLIGQVNFLCEQKKFQDAQRQALYAIVKFHAGNIIYSHFEKDVKSSQKIILTSLEREHHTFPLLSGALLCCHHKKNFFYLNSNLPAKSIIEATKATESNILILSVPVNELSEAEILPILDEVIETLCVKVKIWLLGDFNTEKINVNRWKNTRHIKNQMDLNEILESST